jgi:type IV secretory pathway VirB4 component
MSKHNSLDIKPIDLKEYTCKQSRHAHVPKVPIRMILLAPSGSGKTVLISNLIMNIYRGCFERIYIFSPSVDIDATWGPVKKYQQDDMKVIQKDREKLYFDHYDPNDLERIIDTQHKVTKLVKAQGRKKMFSILIVIDDFADDANFTRHSKLLHSLYTRGRHNSISTIVSTQKFAAIHPIIRVNATSLIVYRLRNNKELESFLEEVSGLTGKKDLLEIYRLATADEYSFLYCNLTARNVQEMFFKNFTTRIQLED